MTDNQNRPRYTFWVTDIFGIHHEGEGDTKEEARAKAMEKMKAVIETRLQEDDDLD